MLTEIAIADAYGAGFEFCAVEKIRLHNNLESYCKHELYDISAKYTDDTQMSIARHYGGLTYQGQSYRIAAHEDGQPLVRWDVIKREAVEAKVRAKAEKQAAKLAQGKLL